MGVRGTRQPAQDCQQSLTSITKGLRVMDIVCVMFVYVRFVTLSKASQCVSSLVDMVCCRQHHKQAKLVLMT